MYVVVHEGEHYVGGTEAGVQFLKDCGTYVPYSFLGYLSAKESGMYIYVQCHIYLHYVILITNPYITLVNIIQVS